MDDSGCPSSGCQSGSLRGLGDPSPVPPQCAASVVKNAVKSRRTRGGKSVNLPPSGAARTRQSDACAPLPSTTEVIPPILAPLQKYTPQGIGNGSIAAIRASIDAVALAESSNDDNDDNDAEYSFFGELANPDPEDLSPHDISGNFIALFVGSRKCQMSYTKARKIKIFYEALTVNKKSILGNSPPQEVTKKFNLWSQALLYLQGLCIQRCGHSRLPNMQVPVPNRHIPREGYHRDGHQEAMQG
jgi:hypothetical protein